MDFVTKKVFEANLKKVGRDIGLPGNGGGSSSTGQGAGGPWSMFTSGDDHIGRDPELGGGDRGEVAQEELFPGSAAAFFDSQPRNYPPFVRLFFVDRTIVAPDVAGAVTWAFRAAHLVAGLLLLNVAVTATVVAVRRGREWYMVLIAAPIAVLIALYQCILADTAFRGVYRSNKHLRARYMLMALVNLGAPIALYALLGTGFFNGWLRLETVAKDRMPDLNSVGRVTWRILAVIEAVCWTAALFVQTYAVFEMYGVWNSGRQGLSGAALAASRNGSGGGGQGGSDGAAAEGQQSSRPAARDDGRDLETRERMEYIRQKYAGQS